MRAGSVKGTSLEERFSVRRPPVASTPTFADEVKSGLTSTPKQLQPKYFYDDLGSALFAAICELPEYYVTRAETEILRRSRSEIARAFGSVDRVIELGAGNGRKTQILIDAILSRQDSLLFQPVDVDESMLRSSGREMLAAFPSLTIEAVCADYREIPRLITPARTRTIVFFLGSSIGNLDAAAATKLLRDIRRVLNPGDGFLLGVDLKKDTDVLNAAYDDSLGVTAAFNLNVLSRINRELGGNFDLSTFAHRAFFNEAESRIEMHLVSRKRQSVRIDSLALDIAFEEGETIHTENSYKYDERDVEALADAAGYDIGQRWTDARGWFADVLLRAR